MRLTPTVWRIGILCGLLVGAQLVVRLLFDTFAPPAPNGYGPRSTMSTLLAVGTFLVTGFAAGYRTRRVVNGALAAVVASLVGHAIGILVTLVLFFAVIRHDLTMSRTFEMTGGFDETFFLPVMLLPIVAGLGLVGDAIGIGLGSISKSLRTAGRT